MKFSAMDLIRAGLNGKIRLVAKTFSPAAYLQSLRCTSARKADRDSRT